MEGYPAAVEPTRRMVGFGFQEHEKIEGGMRREVYLVCQVVYGSIVSSQEKPINRGMRRWFPAVLLIREIVRTMCWEERWLDVQCWR